MFPIDFGEHKPNYLARYFREQLASAATEDAAPIHVWLWPQGRFTPESWQSVNYARGERAKDYLDALRDFSSAFGNHTKGCILTLRDYLSARAAVDFGEIGLPEPRLTGKIGKKVVQKAFRRRGRRPITGGTCGLRASAALDIQACANRSHHGWHVNGRRKIVFRFPGSVDMPPGDAYYT